MAILAVEAIGESHPGGATAFSMQPRSTCTRNLVTARNGLPSHIIPLSPMVEIIYDNMNNMRQSDVPIRTAIIGSIFRQRHFSRCHEIKADWDKRSLAVLMSWSRPNRPNRPCCCWSISVLLPVPLLWKAVVSPQPTCYTAHLPEHSPPGPRNKNVHPSLLRC